jgi:tRNA A-37 threonylcarbamoyl transferase component Bud32
MTPTVAGSARDARPATDLRAIVAGACDAPEVHGAAWRIQGDATWIVVRRDARESPAQGWKLHVSAGVGSAEAVLRRALPVLLRADADFKVAASLDVLGALNDGRGSISQIGKFVTVYPNDDAQAVHLAVALDEATRGLRGPAIPSDRPLRRGSLVHYRFGAFGRRLMQTPLGETAFALVTPDGELAPDERTPVFRAPAWASDPFLTAGVADEPLPVNPLVAGRYLILAPVHGSARGAVFLALDVEAPRRCVMKQARRDAQMMPDGRDARDALRHEAAILRELSASASGLAPAPVDLVEQDGDLYLVMEDLEGESLDRHVAGRVIRGQLMPGEQIVSVGRQLAALLGRLHALGFVYRDLKSANVILTPDGQARLIDFELVQSIGSISESFGVGTRGYMPPEQEAGSPAAVSDDVYALGSLLSFLATGAEPSQGPDRFSPLARPLDLLNPAIGPRLIETIARCVSADPADRFPSMDDLDTALAGVTGKAAVLPPPFGGERVAEPESVAQDRARGLARRLGDTICGAARRSVGADSVSWVTEHDVAGGNAARDLNIGCAGTLLALAEIVGEFGDPVHRTTLDRGTRWLIDAPPLDGTPAPGFYVGAAGIAAVLLRAGQVLGRPDLIELVIRRGRWIASLPHVSPDLFNGTAGRLRFHLMLWDETGDRDALDDAIRAGNVLLTSAQESASGGLCWTIPDGYGSLSARASLGYAHGAAGIADALLDLFDATGDDRYLDAATAAARWLVPQAVAVLPDKSGLAWPSGRERHRRPVSGATVRPGSAASCCMPFASGWTG